MAGERHFINGGGALNWSLTANWSLTEGGAGGQAVPSAAEDVFFDAGSPDCTLNSTNKVCKTLTATAYTHTLTFTYGLSVSGSITIGSGVQWAGTAALIMLAAGTWTTNGNTIGVPVTIGNFTSGTVILADDLTISGDLQLINATSTTFSGDFHIYAATCSISATQTVTIVHDVTISGLTTIATQTVLDGLYNWNTGGITISVGALTGTTTIVLTGGTLTASAAAISNSITFAGDVTLAAAIFYFAASGTPTLTHSSGTITTTGSTLSIASSCTLDTDPIGWNNITLTGTSAITLTLNSLLTVTGTFTIANASVTFDGTSGFTVGTLTHTVVTITRTFTFEEAVTYTITTAITAPLPGAPSYKYTYTSADGAIKAIITLGYGATQSIVQVNPTRIDSSLGQCIFSDTGVITTCFNWSNDLGHGRIIPEAGGESVTVAGITKDNAGVALGSCDVYLFRDNGTDTATYIAYQESNSVTGAYSFAVFPGSAYFVVAFKGGATPVMDVTDRTVTAV
jgi:hypothetical protein